MARALVFLALLLPGCVVHGHGGFFSSTDHSAAYLALAEQLEPLPGPLYVGEVRVDNQARGILRETDYDWGVSLDPALARGALIEGLGLLAGCEVVPVDSTAAFLEDPPARGTLLQVRLDEAFLLSTGREALWLSIPLWFFTGFGALWVHDTPFVLSVRLEVSAVELTPEGPREPRTVLAMEEAAVYEDSLNFFERIDTWSSYLIVFILPPTLFGGDRTLIQQQLLGGVMLEPTRQLVEALRP